jgi:hypothetical protein
MNGFQEFVAIAVPVVTQAVALIMFIAMIAVWAAIGSGA